MIIDYEGVVHLDSDAHDARTIHNRPSEFVNFMHSAFSFSSEDYDVGLHEIQIPCTWHNLPEGQFCVAFKGTTLVSSFKAVAGGCYYNVEELISSINFHFTASGEPQLKYDEKRDRVVAVSGKIGTSSDVHIVMSKDLARILGFTRRYMHIGSCTPDESDTSLMLTGMCSPLQISASYVFVHDNRDAPSHAATLAPSLMASVPRLYIRSSLVKQGGGNSRQLLRAIPAEPGKKFGDILVKTFDRPIFVPLSHTYFDRIDLRITDSQGKEVQFKAGNVVATLELKRKTNAFF